MLQVQFGISMNEWLWGVCIMHAVSSRGGSRGAHTGPPPSSGLSWRDTRIEVCHALSARSYFDAAHISIWVAASCPAYTERSNLQLPSWRDSSVAAPQTQSWFRREGLRETTIRIDESPEFTLQYSHKYSLMASEALSHGLNIKIFMGEHAPRPSYKTVHALYTWSRFCATYVLQVTNVRRPVSQRILYPSEYRIPHTLSTSE